MLIGEGVYGWTTVADTTDWRYWCAEIVAGVAVLGIAVFRRPATHLFVAVGTAALTAIAVLFGARLA